MDCGEPKLPAYLALGTEPGDLHHLELVSVIQKKALSGIMTGKEILKSHNVIFIFNKYQLLREVSLFKPNTIA